MDIEIESMEEDGGQTNDLEFIEQHIALSENVANDINVEFSVQNANKIHDSDDDLVVLSVDGSDDTSGNNNSMMNDDKNGPQILSSSDSGSDSDDDDDDDDDDIISASRSMLQDFLTEDEIGIDDSGISGPLKTKNEIEELIIPPPIHYIDVMKEKILEIGSVISRIDSEYTIVVQAHMTSTPLNEGSTLCLSNGYIFGNIQEIFGPLTCPYYVVKWSNSKLMSSTTSYSIQNVSTTKSGNTKNNSNNNNNNKRNNQKNRNKNNKNPTNSSVTIALNEDKNDVDNNMMIMESDTVSTVMDSNNNSDNIKQESINNNIYVDNKIASITNNTNISNSIYSDSNINGDIKLKDSSYDWLSIIQLINVGTPVYRIERMSQLILPHAIKKDKGSDASNVYDEEIPVEEQEYSDDEAEMEAKRIRNQQKRKNQSSSSNTTTTTTNSDIDTTAIYDSIPTTTTTTTSNNHSSSGNNRYNNKMSSSKTYQSYNKHSHLTQNTHRHQSTTNTYDVFPAPAPAQSYVNHHISSSSIQTSYTSHGLKPAPPSTPPPAAAVSLPHVYPNNAMYPPISFSSHMSPYVNSGYSSSLNTMNYPPNTLYHQTASSSTTTSSSSNYIPLLTSQYPTSQSYPTHTISPQPVINTAATALPWEGFMGMTSTQNQLPEYQHKPLKFQMNPQSESKNPP